MLSTQKQLARHVWPPRRGTRLAVRGQPLQKHFSSTTMKRLPQYERFRDQPGSSNANSRPWGTRHKVAASIVALSGVYYVAHLERVAETGRWRFMDISPTMEARLVEESKRALKEELGPRALPPNHPLTRHVHRIVTRILEANNLGTLTDPNSSSGVSTWFGDPFGTHVDSDIPGTGKQQWELIVVKDDSVVNAMASYGTVVVFTGILPVAKDEEGLASVISHEIAHAVARHSQERYSSTKILLAVSTLLMVLGLDIGISNALSKYLLQLPNSRAQELEADAIGLRLAAKACYNPGAAIEMFSRMEQLDKATRLDVNFLYTHPTSQTRIQRLNVLLPDAYAIRNGNPDCVRTQEHLFGFRDAMGLVRGSPSTVWGWA